MPSIESHEPENPFMDDHPRDTFFRDKSGSTRMIFVFPTGMAALLGVAALTSGAAPIAALTGMAAYATAFTANALWRNRNIQTLRQAAKEGKVDLDNLPEIVAYPGGMTAAAALIRQGKNPESWKPRHRNQDLRTNPARARGLPGEPAIETGETSRPERLNLQVPSDNRPLRRP